MNIAYPLFPVSVITILAYFTTWLFSQWDIFSRKLHRKFWNILLLITFLVSGLLGLVSVVKVNYKIEIPNYDLYIQLHVAFGIGMVIISFFHLSWHLKYYFTLKKNKTDKPLKTSEMKETNLEKFRILLVVLGLITIINQIVFIREFINVLSGNELILGIVLASWMLLTGWGAYSGRKGNFSEITIQKGILMLATISVLPVLLVSMLYWLKSQLFPPGTMVGMGVSVASSVLLLFPVCFLSGYLFTAFSALYSESKKTNLTGKSYSLESVGSLAGGLIFSLLLGRIFNSFQIFGLTTAAVLFTGAFIFKSEKKKFLLLLSIGIFAPALIFILNPDNQVKKLQFPNQQLLINRSTRYGDLVVTQQAGQLNIYENSDLQFYTENMMQNEEAVHFAMVQHDNPKNILLISGGISGMINEIEKYNVDKITYLEINPEIFKSLHKLDTAGLNFSNVEIVKSDIRTFIRKTDQKYDVVLLNLPPPVSLGLNRFYTKEFFKSVKNRGNNKVVVCTSLPTTANYAEKNALEVNSSLLKTLKVFFKNTLILPGEKNYFLASDQPLTASIVEKTEEKNITNEYVNQYYFDDALLTARSQTLTEQIKPDVPVNLDFSPFIFIRQIGHWLSHFGTSYKIIVIIPAFLFLLFFARTNALTAGLYTGGFTAGSLEVLLMLAYQVYFGSLYIATAFFFAVFMAGLAKGSSISLRTGISLVKNYYRIQFGLAVFAILLPFFIQFVGKFSEWRMPAQFLFFVLIFSLSFGIGYEFLIASKLHKSSYSETSGINYSVDLAGSAFGAFLTAVVLLPLAGLLQTCVLVAAMNILSGTMALTKQKASIF